MAEVAGLVIGGISMAALVDGCMKTFDRIESARTYGRDYQKATLKLSLLQLRLSRWSESVIKTVQEQHLISIGSSQQAEQVKELLGDIGEAIERTSRFATRYDPGSTFPKMVQDEKDVATMESLTNRVKTMAIQRQQTSTFGQKTRWALRDQRKFKKLLEGLTESISDLEVLFPPEQLAYFAEAQNQLARKEASELVQPSGIEEPEDARIVVSILEDATSDIDTTLQKAIENARRSKPEGSHTFGQINVADTVRIHVGDYVAPGHRVTGAGHTYGSLTATGTCRVMYGNSYGGKNVLDD